jgi:phosphopantetheinyl transferase (holo-ACP synthase)
MEIRRQLSGQPYVVLHGAGLVLLAKRGATQIHISLSHTQAHATAVAVLEALP